jgi:hypothetical protein
MSTLPVVEEILRTANHPMSVREIVDVAGDKLPTKSKTPDTVVARDLSMDIKRKGDDSLFVRTSPGRYAMRDRAHEFQGSEQAGTGGDHQPKPAETTTPVLGSAMTEDRAGTLSARKRSNNGSSEDSMPA